MNRLNSSSRIQHVPHNDTNGIYNHQRGLYYNQQDPDNSTVTSVQPRSSPTEGTILISDV